MPLAETAAQASATLLSPCWFTPEDIYPPLLGTTPGLVASALAAGSCRAAATATAGAAALVPPVVRAGASRRTSAVPSRRRPSPSSVLVSLPLVLLLSLLLLLLENPLVALPSLSELESLDRIAGRAPFRRNRSAGVRAVGGGGGEAAAGGAAKAAPTPSNSSLKGRGAWGRSNMSWS